MFFWLKVHDYILFNPIVTLFFIPLYLSSVLLVPKLSSRVLILDTLKPVQKKKKNVKRPGATLHILFSHTVRWCTTILFTNRTIDRLSTSRSHFDDRHHEINYLYICLLSIFPVKESDFVIIFRKPLIQLLLRKFRASPKRRTQQIWFVYETS